MSILLKIHGDGSEEFKESGARVDAIGWDEGGNFKEVKGHEPIVGCSLLVGSVTARTYGNQDYWLTTTITEILEKTEEYWLFKTQNSTYKLLI
jgi:hypothetical protein